MLRSRSIVALAAFALAVGLAFSHGPAAATGTTTQKSTTMKSTSTTKHASMPKVDINTASKDELMKLPGIGDALADKIVANRPYKSKSDLTSKKILTQKEFSAVASHIVAKQPASSTAAKTK
jgi:DNA uptake protein ComE-like DNA-binding protein